jgi:hypothetical protein
MDWQSLLVTYGPWALTLVMGLVAWWLGSNKDVREMKERLAQVIGDGLVFLVQAAQGQMGKVTDDMLRAEADIIYGKLAALMPPRFYDIATKLYTKADFQELVIKAWRNLQSRSLVVKGKSRQFYVE